MQVRQLKSRGAGPRLVCDLVSDKIDLMEFGHYCTVMRKTDACCLIRQVLTDFYRALCVACNAV